MSAVARTTFPPGLMFLLLTFDVLLFEVSTFRCRVMGKPCKHASVMWLYNLDLWPLRSPHTSMTWVIVLHPCTTKFIGLPIPEIFGLMTLTFDLSTSKWGHVASVSWSSFLSIFSFKPFQPSRQTVGHTDDGHQRFMPHGCGGKINFLSKRNTTTTISNIRFMSSHCQNVYNQ